VDVRTGLDRAVANGAYVITDFTAGSVYLYPWRYGIDGPGSQIGTAMDPTTGALRSLPGGTKYGWWVGGGAGWRDAYNTADPTPHPVVRGTNELIRIDLATQKETTWFYQQGLDAVSVLGFDQAGHPVIFSWTQATDATTVWVLTDATHRTKLFSTKQQLNQALADSHGIWFSYAGSSGTYFYDSTGGFRQVSRTGGQVAGGCH
jgi:hypothetical protein